MTFEELLRIVWRHRWTVLLVTAVATAGTYFISSSFPDVYETQADLLVSIEGASGADFEATQSAQVLAKTYAELIQRRTVATRVGRELGGEVDVDSLLDDMSFSPIRDTRLIAVVAEAGSPLAATHLANTYARTFVDIVRDALAKKTAGTVSIANQAIPPESPVRPKPALYSMIVFFIALFVGGGLAVLRDRLGKRLGDEEEVGPALDLPVLARIPVTRSNHKQPLAIREPGFEEAFRVLSANLDFIGPVDGASSILVTSPGMMEGKTTCAAGLAAAVAEQGYRVTLIEADMRQPTLAPGRGKATGGLSALLRDRGALQDVAEQTGIPNLSLIPAGEVHGSPATLLRSDRLEQLVAEISASSDFVVVDSPPVSVGPDALLLAAAVDGVLLVVSSRKTDLSAATGAAADLRRARAHLLGVIINEAPGPQASYGRSNGHRDGNRTRSTLRLGRRTRR